MHRPCFIVSHRYYRNYPSYLIHYIQNINEFYENSLIILVDNNSKYLNDIVKEIEINILNKSNLIILVNNSDCKFEIGAYKIGINYIISNNLLEIYDYYVFTQDNFILKNKYDFNILNTNNTVACPLYTYNVGNDNCFQSEISQTVLKNINLENRINELSLCWCQSFILNHTKIIDFLNIVKDIVITTRYESECSERFLCGILYYLNNYILTSIDGESNTSFLEHCLHVDLINDKTSKHFVKRLQQKNEFTLDD